jgi:hypothetical protein
LIRRAARNPLVWYLAFLAVLLVWLAFSGLSCRPYDPTLYPSYDVLNPSAEVRLSPLAFTADGNLVVSPAFIAWVDELKQEIVRLRKGK